MLAARPQRPRPQTDQTDRAPPHAAPARAPPAAVTWWGACPACRKLPRSVRHGAGAFELFPGGGAASGPEHG